MQKNFLAYNSWVAMKQRCTNKRSKRYDASWLCERWHSFDKFLEDMGERPADHALHRKDVSKGFDKKNCQWSTHEEQAKSRRNSVVITYQGKAQTLKKWSRDTGIPEPTIRGRLQRNWTTADALTTPPKVLESYEYLHKNEYKTLSSWARDYGLSPTVVHGRITNGWSIKRALLTPNNNDR